MKYRIVRCVYPEERVPIFFGEKRKHWGCAWERIGKHPYKDHADAESVLREISKEKDFDREPAEQIVWESK